MNARTIRVSKANLAVSDLTFRGQVITIVNQVINAYYALATSYEQVRASRNATDVAEEFLTNVRKQIELGAVAPPEAINAESQAVTTRRQLVDDETTLQQREVRLKNLISRTGLSDPLLATVRVVPVDRPTIPATDDLPPLEQMVREAQTARTDLAIQFANQQTTEINAAGTRNGLLPTLVAFATMQTSGLAGTERILERPGQPPQRPDPYFVGGIGTALGQVFRRNFPTQRGGAFFGATINNRQAQADYAIDELSIAQNELALAKGNNQLQVEVMNYVVAIQQARARYARGCEESRTAAAVIRKREQAFPAWRVNSVQRYPAAARSHVRAVQRSRCAHLVHKCAACPGPDPRANTGIKQHHAGRSSDGQRRPSFSSCSASGRPCD